MKAQPQHEPALTYETAWAELQTIVQALQSEAIGVDALAEKIARAGELAAFCRERLRQTEARLETLAKQQP
jgi:exodeoxyribonuclease VII small subunit